MPFTRRFRPTLVLLIVCLAAPALASSQVQTFTATHTYIMGDHDSKDDARQRCLLEGKRKILEQAGVYIESASELNNFDLTKDKITSFAAAVMQVKDTKEEVGFQRGHMTLMLTLTAQVDLAEVRKQLVARQVDASVRGDVTAQKERLERLEAQLEAIQREIQLAPGRTPSSPLTDISAADVQMLRTLAAQGNAAKQTLIGALYLLGRGVPQDDAQAAKWFNKAAVQGDADGQSLLGLVYSLGRGVSEDYAQAAQWYQKAAAQGNAMAQGRIGTLYDFGLGVPQDYIQARQWYEKAAAQSNAEAQWALGMMYANGVGIPQDYVQARQWFEKAAAQDFAAAQVQLGVLYENGSGVPQDDVRAYMWNHLAAAHSTGASRKVATEKRNEVARRITPAQVAEAQRLTNRCQAQQFKGC